MVARPSLNVLVVLVGFFLKLYLPESCDVLTVALIELLGIGN